MIKLKCHQLNKHFLKHLRNESGSVLVLFAAFMVVGIGFSALVVDLGALRLDKSRLVNAVDAAALAGAYELPSTSQAEQVAREYAAHNEVDSADVTVSFGSSNGTITVKATRERNFVFGQILGINTGSVQAEATAAAGTVGSMTGVLPIGVLESAYIELGAGDGFELVAKDTHGDFGPGNWKFVYLDGNVDTPEQIAYLEGGFDGLIHVGKIIRTAPGSNLAAQGRQVLVDYANNGKTLYIPIVDYENEDDKDKDPTGTYPMEVKGYAAITITNVSGSSANLVVSAVLNPTGAEFVQGGFDPNAGNYGLKSIALIN